MSDARAPGAAALHDALAAVVASGSTRVPLVLELSSPGKVEGPTSPLAVALAARLNAIRGAAGLERVMILAPAAAAGSARVAFFVRREPAPEGRLTGGARLVIAGASAPAFTWTATVGPGDVGTPDDRLAIEALASKLSAALGLGGVAEAVGRAAAPVASPSPYSAHKTTPRAP